MTETVSRVVRESTLFIEVPFHGLIGESSTSGFGWWKNLTWPGLEKVPM
jgi:hypothetical protein